MSRTTDWMKKTIEYIAKTRRFERHMKDVKLLSMSNGECKAELLVSKDQLNTEGHLSRGLTITLVDVSSILALFSYTNGMTGISTNINVSFVQQAFPGDVLLINAKVFQVQSPLIFIEVELAKKNGGDNVARGQHTLFLTPFDPKNLKK